MENLTPEQQKQVQQLLKSSSPQKIGTDSPANQSPAESHPSKPMGPSRRDENQLIKKIENMGLDDEANSHNDKIPAKKKKLEFMELYSEELKELSEAGFKKQMQCINLLNKTGGNVQVVKQFLSAKRMLEKASKDVSTPSSTKTEEDEMSDDQPEKSSKHQNKVKSEENKLPPTVGLCSVHAQMKQKKRAASLEEREVKLQQKAEKLQQKLESTQHKNPEKLQKQLEKVQLKKEKAQEKKEKIQEKREMKLEKKAEKILEKREKKISEKADPNANQKNVFADPEKRKKLLQERKEKLQNSKKAQDTTGWNPQCTHLYIDANNQLFCSTTTRQLVLKKKRSQAELILVQAAKEFAIHQKLALCVVIFDFLTIAPFEVDLEFGKLIVGKAIPHFNTSDDALVEMAKTAPEHSFFLTADNELKNRLHAATQKEIHTMGPKRFLIFAAQLAQSELEPYLSSLKLKLFQEEDPVHNSVDNNNNNNTNLMSDNKNVRFETQSPSKSD